METSIIVLPKYCSCCKRLGILQEELESKIKEKFTEGKKLQEVQKDVILNDFNIKKMCCLNNIKGSSYFIVDTYFNMIKVDPNVSGLESKNGPKTIKEKNMYELPTL